MMVPLTRTDTSVLGRWWWTVDRWSLFLLCALTGIGLVLTGAASPAVAERLNLPPTHFLLLVPSAQARAASPRAGGGGVRGAGGRYRNQGCAPLDHLGRPVAAGFRIRQARLRRHRGLDVRGPASGRGHSRQRHLSRPAVRCRWLAVSPTGCGSDGRRNHRLV